MAFFKQENCYSKITSVRKNLHLSKSFKNRKLLAAENVGNILAFDKESKRKLLSHISADSFIKNNIAYNFRIEFLLCLNRKFFDFKKTSLRYYGFLVATNVFL